MKTAHFLTAAAALCFAAPLAADNHVVSLESAADDALESDGYAWDFVEGITTEVGPRQAGTEAEARGRAWSVAWLKRHGFANVADEPYQMETWLPGDIARARVTAPFAQDMTIVPLGTSVATPVGGIEAEVVYFKTTADLVAAPAGSLTGKIAFVSHEIRLALWLCRARALGRFGYCGEQGRGCHGDQVGRHRQSPHAAYRRDQLAGGRCCDARRRAERDRRTEP